MNLERPGRPTRPIDERIDAIPAIQPVVPPTVPRTFWKGIAIGLLITALLIGVCMALLR
ncbi:MAG TPA: hypothetical protein VGM74_22880 [Burkholderiaceae bacterium]